MRFERIEIRNLRSFGSEKTVIEAGADRNLVAVVGANNAGKSDLAGYSPAGGRPA